MWQELIVALLQCVLDSAVPPHWHGATPRAWWGASAGAEASHLMGDDAGPAGPRSWWHAAAKPPVRCELEAILNSAEGPAATRAWVAALERVAPMRTNTGQPIRKAVLAAVALSEEPEARRGLHHEHPSIMSAAHRPSLTV